MLWRIPGCALELTGRTSFDVKRPAYPLLLPVLARKSRQLITQKLPVMERNVGSADVPLKAAERRQAGRGQQPTKCLCAKLIDRMRALQRNVWTGCGTQSRSSLDIGCR